MGDPDGRNLRQPQLQGGLQTAMPGDHAIFVDQQRIGEAEGSDAVGYLADLPVVMGARIARRRGEMYADLPAHRQVVITLVPCSVRSQDCERTTNGCAERAATI